jgi:glycosyltransferase involved in cell wall biosynthesis
MSLLSKQKVSPKVVYNNVKEAEKPLVSVIIPTLKSRNMELERAVHSIKKQTYEHIEIIIEEGGRNPQEARNIAVRKSRGKYLAFMNDDDQWYPTKIEKQVAYMESHDECTLCITWGDDYKFGFYHLIKPKPHWTFKELIAGFNISCTSAFLCRRSSFYAVGGMDEGLDDLHEYDLALKLSCIGTVYCIQESLVRFCQILDNVKMCDDNWSADFEKKIRGMFQFVRKWGHCFDTKRWVKTALCFCLFTWGKFIHGQSAYALFNWTKSLQEQS